MNQLSLIKGAPYSFRYRPRTGDLTGWTVRVALLDSFNRVKATYSLGNGITDLTEGRFLVSLLASHTAQLMGDSGYLVFELVSSGGSQIEKTVPFTLTPNRIP